MFSVPEIGSCNGLSSPEIHFNEILICLSLHTITYDDFSKLDLRVAKIRSVERIPEKTKIIKGTIDLGDEERTVIIGGSQFYEPESLVGKTVVVVANLEPKKIGDIESDAMLLAADVNNKPFWLTTHADVPAGTRIK